MFQLENYLFFAAEHPSWHFPASQIQLKQPYSKLHLSQLNYVGLGVFYYYYFSSELTFTSFIIPCSQNLLLPLFTESDPSALTPAKLSSIPLSPGRTLLEPVSEVIHLYLFLNELELYFFCSHPLSAYVPESY